MVQIGLKRFCIDFLGDVGALEGIITQAIISINWWRIKFLALFLRIGSQARSEWIDN